MGKKKEQKITYIVVVVLECCKLLEGVFKSIVVNYISFP